MNLNAAIVAYKAERFHVLAPSTRANNLALIHNYIVPKLGLREVNAISQTDIIGLHKSMGETPYMANRMLAFISALFVHYKLPNPAKGVTRYNEETREYYITPEDLNRLLGALASHPDKPFTTAIKLLVFTGCRRSEILGAQW